MPNFVITVNPESLDICSDENAEFNIQIDPILNFTNPVSLSVEDIPDNVSVNFDPVEVSPGDNSILTISSPSGIEIGNYSFTISAISGDIIHELDIDMNVYEDLPQVPQLLFPNPDLVGVSQTPIFDWDDQERLTKTLIAAKNRGVKLLVSGLKNNRLIEKYQELGKLIPVSRKTVIAGENKARGQYTEIVVKVNY